MGTSLESVNKMEGMSNIVRSGMWNLGPDERFLINQVSHRAEPEKALREIVDREGAISPVGQYAQLLLNVMPETIQKNQPIEDRDVLPVLIVARNEEMLLPRTLKTLMDSAIDFQKVHFGVHVAIVLSNNVSTDETTAAVVQFYCEHYKELVSNHISIEVVYEGKPGKINGIKRGLKHIKKSFAKKYGHVLFSDADVDWDKGAISALWETAHPGTGGEPLLVGSNITPRNRITLWGLLEELAYYGYGLLPPRNQGVFTKFISGMGYIADERVLFHLEDMPENTGNEDVALSALVGPENIVIAADAIVGYNLSEDWNTFVKIRGRHVRELLRLEKWLSEKYGEEKAAGMLSSVVELGAFPVINGFFKPTAPLEPLDGSLHKNIGRIIRHIESVPVLSKKNPFMDVYVGTVFISFTYFYLLYRGIRQLYKVPWWIALIGLEKKIFRIPYVTFLQNREPKKEDKARVASSTKGDLWDPAMHRKNQGPVQYKGLLSPVRDVLSNNLNWARAAVVIIEAFVFQIVLKRMFLSVSETLSVIAMNMTATPDIATAHPNPALTGTYANNVKGLFESLSQATSFIGQHIPIFFIALCLSIYICLFIFHALQSMKTKKSIGGKLVDLLKSTNNDFGAIVAFPFIALGRGVLFLIVAPITFARLIVKKLL